MKVKAVQGKQDPLEWTETSGVTWNGGTTHEFLSPFLCSAPPLEMRRKRWEFFPEEAGKDPSSRIGGGNGAPLEEPGRSCFLWSGDGYIGEAPEL